MENYLDTHTHVTNFPCGATPCAMPAQCPLQILVIDHENGPAHTLIDVLSRVFGPRVSYILADDESTVQYVLACCEPELIVAGLDARAINILALLPDIRSTYRTLPILAVGRHVSCFTQEESHQFGADEVLDLPYRAAELKSLVVTLAQPYLQPAGSAA